MRISYFEGQKGGEEDADTDLPAAADVSVGELIDKDVDSGLDHGSLQHSTAQPLSQDVGKTPVIV